jgi:site-specific recombinase XerC
MASPYLADLAAAFRRDLHRLKKADRTVELYDQSIRYFSAWLTAQGRPVTLDQFTRPAIVAWLADLADRGNAAGTLAARQRGLRRFGRWLVAEGELETAPTEGITMPDSGDGPAPVLEADDLARILALCRVPRGKAGAYDRAIFEGRRDEVLVRLLADCGLDRERVWVMGKGSRPRDVTFGSPETGPSLDRYLRARRTHPYAERTKRLLLSQRGPISADGIRWRLEKLGEAVGIKGLHPHSFRHTRAHNWLAKGGSERGLMAQMGWRSDSMLSVYARSTQIERSHNEARRLARDDGSTGKASR